MLPWTRQSTSKLKKEKDFTILFITFSKRNRRDREGPKKLSRKISLEERARRRTSTSSNHQTSSNLVKQYSGSLSSLTKNAVESRKPRHSNKLSKNRKIRSNENIDQLPGSRQKEQKLSRQKTIMSTSQDSLYCTNKFLSGAGDWNIESPVQRSSSNSDLETDAGDSDCDEASNNSRR